MMDRAVLWSQPGLDLPPIHVDTRKFFCIGVSGGLVVSGESTTRDYEDLLDPHTFP